MNTVLYVLTFRHQIPGVPHGGGVRGYCGVENLDCGLRYDVSARLVFVAGMTLAAVVLTLQPLSRRHRSASAYASRSRPPWRRRKLMKCA
jgi:hypothetical protein